MNRSQEVKSGYEKNLDEKRKLIQQSSCYPRSLNSMPLEEYWQFNVMRPKGWFYECRYYLWEEKGQVYEFAKKHNCFK